MGVTFWIVASEALQMSEFYLRKDFERSLQRMKARKRITKRERDIESEKGLKKRLLLLLLILVVFIYFCPCLCAKPPKDHDDSDDDDLHSAM